MSRHIIMVNRVFRGDTYNITVKNPNHVCTGVSSLTVDGIKVDGNIIPYYNDGKAHSVEVILGQFYQQQGNRNCGCPILIVGEWGNYNGI